MAAVVASAYEATSGDDSLLLQVRKAMEGLEPDVVAPITVLAEDPPETSGAEPIRALEVQHDDLINENIQPFVKLFSTEGSSSEQLLAKASLWGKCRLAFAVDDDPRPVTMIPEVRRFVRTLHQKMPYFPCYLDLRPELSMFFAYFGALADQSALSADGRQINLMHESVISRVAESVAAIQQIAARCGRDANVPLQSILGAHPPNISRTLYAPWGVWTDLPGCASDHSEGSGSTSQRRHNHDRGGRPTDRRIKSFVRPSLDDIDAFIEWDELAEQVATAPCTQSVMVNGRFLVAAAQLLGKTAAGKANLTTAYRLWTLNEFEYAQRFFERAAALLKDHDPFLEATAMSYRVDCLRHLLRFREVEKAGRELPSFAAEQGFDGFKALALRDLGTALSRIGEHEEAARCLQQALSERQLLSPQVCVHQSVSPFREILDFRYPQFWHGAHLSDQRG